MARQRDGMSPIVSTRVEQIIAWIEARIAVLASMILELAVPLSGIALSVQSQFLFCSAIKLGPAVMNCRAQSC